MPGEQFCLRWNNHQPNFISVFSSLLENDQMVDVTLISDNREIHAHKIVLSACSPFFQNIFLRSSCKHPVIVLTGIKYIHIKSLIDFIYNGEVNIYQDQLAELLRVANILKIKGLDEVAPNELDESIGKSSGERHLAAAETSKSSENDESTKRNELNVPSTSNQTKTTKKRKSVSFSDTPQVCDQHSSSSSQVESQIETTGNGKRKLRSLSDICSITKIKKEHDNEEHSGIDDDDDDDDNEKPPNQSAFVVTINPHSLYSSTEPLSTAESPVKKQRTNTSRKMIRKNENFLRALEAVRDEGIGFCKAAKIHGVNNRTLWLEYQKLGYPMKNARKKSQT